MGDGETVILFMAEIRRSPVRVVDIPLFTRFFLPALLRGTGKPMAFHKSLLRPAISGGGGSVDQP